MSDIQDEAYTELCEENARLKSLLNRAADALEDIEACKYWQWAIDLSAELRKAAQ